MKKKLIAILIALTMAVSLLPMPAMAANADHKAQVKAAVTKVITDYAAQVARPNAADDAFWDFTDHGLKGKGAKMIVKESDPVVSAIFNAYLMQEALIEGITAGILEMQELSTDTFFLRGGPSWHDSRYRYGYDGILSNQKDYGNYLQLVVNTGTIYATDEYPGPRNENDQMMELLAGDLTTGGVALTNTQITDDTITVQIDIRINESFDFTGNDYDKLNNKGYDTSKDDRMNQLGVLLTMFGLDEFVWVYDKTLYVEVPNTCKHQQGNAYHWTLDSTSNTLLSSTASGITQNAATKIEAVNSTTGEISCYYKLDTPVKLNHDAPWVVEYETVGLQSLTLSPLDHNYATIPHLYQYSRYNLWVRKYETLNYENLANAKDLEYRILSSGCDLQNQFQYASKHNYTVRWENKPQADGSNIICASVYDNTLGETVFEPTPLNVFWIQNKGENERVLQERKNNIANGEDIIINYIGNKSVKVGHTALDLRIYENNTPAESSYIAPTCTTDGGMKHHCPDCGADYFTDREPAKGHSFTDYTDDGNSSCTDVGTKTRACTVCGERETIPNEGNPAGHDFGTYLFDHNASCTDDGTKTAVCKVCGEKDTVTAEGSATGHRYEAAVTAPTCTTEGYTTYTCHCGDSYVDDRTPVAPHTEVIDQAVASTCVQQGLTEGKHCAVCGKVTVPQMAAPLGSHTWDAGTVVTAPTLTQPGTLMYTCEICGKTNHMSITELPSTGFEDVPADAYYAAAVAWAKENGITSGITETLFGSDMGCTRGQVVTFLWAAAGRPEPTATENPFTDVSGADYYYKPVLWAAEQGITGGIGEGLFGPDATCTRGQIVTFLWRAMGSPTVSESPDFTDVTAADWFAQPVAWAAENEVTGGIGNGMFGPNNTCTRAQVVTFLYKVYS